ncbi:MAG: hypothetical protein ACREAU_09135, partial [Nitrosopumilaceae archaeon]
LTTLRTIHSLQQRDKQRNKMNPGISIGDNPTVQELKTYNKNLVNEILDQTIYGGVTYLSNVFDTTEPNIKAIVHNAQFANLTIAGTAVWPPSFSYHNNSDVAISLTAQQAVGLAATLFDFITKSRSNAGIHKTNINALATESDVRTYDVTTGWPVAGVDYTDVTPEEVPQKSIISGQVLLTQPDASRGNKRLSVETSGILEWSQSTVSNLTWLSPLSITAAAAGYVMPLKGTIIKVSAYCSNANGNTGNIHLFINSVDKGTIAILSGSGEQKTFSTTLNIDFDANDKIRAQVQGLGLLQTLADVIISVGVKWRV